MKFIFKGVKSFTNFKYRKAPLINESKEEDSFIRRKFCKVMDNLYFGNIKIYT